MALIRLNGTKKKEGDNSPCGWQIWTSLLPAIRKAVEERAKHGVLGYAMVGNSYYEAIINWFKRRHTWEIERNPIIYTTGVIPAISATIKALAMPGENVLIQTPVYNCFILALQSGNANLRKSIKEERKHVCYRLARLESKCADEKTTLFCFANLTIL